MSEKQKTQENPHVKQITAEESLMLSNLTQAKKIAQQQAELAQKDFTAAHAEYTALMSQLAGKYFEGAETVALTQDGRGIINAGAIQAEQAKAQKEKAEESAEQPKKEVS